MAFFGGLRRRSSGPRAVSGEISTVQSGCPLAWQGTAIPDSRSQRTARSTCSARLVAGLSSPVAFLMGANS